MATNIVGATGIDKVQDGIIVDADIDTVAASKLTGALPAISGANLTNLPASGPTHTSAGSAPGSPAIGDFWHDTTNEKLYIRTNDGTSDVWMQI